MQIETWEITDDYGKLLKVENLFWTFENQVEMLGACHFIFENGDVYHEVLTEFDEITSNSELQDQFDVTKDVSAELPWSVAIGKSVLWIWKLTNQQGYHDAIQYSFSGPEARDVILQLMVEASQIRVLEPLGFEVRI